MGLPKHYFSPLRDVASRREKKRAKTIWNFAFFSTIWIIWKERNNWCFEGLEFSSGVTCWKADLYHCFLDSCYPGFLWLSSDHHAFKLEGICYSLHVFLLLCLLSRFLLFSYKYIFLVLLRFCFTENYHLKKKSDPWWGGPPSGLSRSTIGHIKFAEFVLIWVANYYWSFFFNSASVSELCYMIPDDKACSSSYRALPYISCFISDGRPWSTCTSVPCSMYIR